MSDLERMMCNPKFLLCCNIMSLMIAVLGGITFGWPGAIIGYLVGANVGGAIWAVFPDKKVEDQSGAEAE